MTASAAPAPSLSPASPAVAAALLELHGVVLPPLPQPLFLAVAAGEEVILRTPRQGIHRPLLQILAGLQKPAGGSVVFCGRRWADLAGRTAAEARRRLAVVYASGGLIGNLKVWENLLLPLAFHGRAAADQWRRLGEEALHRVGYSGDINALPALLAPAEQKAVELARAFLMQPELLVCDSPQQGLARGELKHFLRLAADWQRERPGRAALYLTADGSLARQMPTARVINLVDGSDYDD